MTNKVNRKNSLVRKRQLILKLSLNSLKIFLRFLKLLFDNKKMACNSFLPDSEYCIEGTLNQLRWDVQNTLFITISNSSQLFFNSGQLLFKVNQEQTELQLTAYGIAKKVKLNTRIKVATLSKKDFSKVAQQYKEIGLNKPKIELSRKIINSSISFKNSNQLKPSRQMHIDINKSLFIQNASTKISLTNSTQELEELKLDLKTDLN